MLRCSSRLCDASCRQPEQQRQPAAGVWQGSSATMFIGVSAHLWLRGRPHAPAVQPLRLAAPRLCSLLHLHGEDLQGGVTVLCQPGALHDGSQSQAAQVVLRPALAVQSCQVQALQVLRGSKHAAAVALPQSRWEGHGKSLQVFPNPTLLMIRQHTFSKCRLNPCRAWFRQCHTPTYDPPAPFKARPQADCSAALRHARQRWSSCPGKQVGMSGVCYPDSPDRRPSPNVYYYAANNPSEATIAKRRSYANTISYLTPPAENAGLYKGLKV